MAMSRSLGSRSFTRAPPTRMLPSVTSSRPAIMRNRRGLAAARGAEQHQEFPVSDMQVHRLHTDEAAPAFRQVLQLDIGHVLSFHGAGGQAADDLALEEHHEDEEGCRHRHDRGDGEHHVGPRVWVVPRKLSILGTMVRFSRDSSIEVTAKLVIGEQEGKTAPS